MKTACSRTACLKPLVSSDSILVNMWLLFSILNKLEKEQIIVNFSDARGYDKVNFWEDNDIEDVDTYDGDDVDDDTDSIGEETKTLHGLRNTTPLDMSCETIDDHENQNDDEIIDNTTDPKFKFESLYFEDEFMKKFNKLTSLKYDNKYRDIFDLIYELEDRVEYLEDKLNSYENSNANTFFTFIKNLFYSKKIC